MNRGLRNISHHTLDYQKTTRLGDKRYVPQRKFLFKRILIDLFKESSSKRFIDFVNGTSDGVCLVFIDQIGVRALIIQKSATLRVDECQRVARRSLSCSLRCPAIAGVCVFRGQ